MAKIIEVKIMTITKAKSEYRKMFPNYWTHLMSNPTDAHESSLKTISMSHLEGYVAALQRVGIIEVKN